MSSDEFNDCSSTNDIQADDVRPKLRLHHLFALTAVMATLLAIQGPQRPATDSQSITQPVPVALWLIWGIVYQIFEAAAVTVLAYGIADYWRRLRFFNQPGHWILVEVSVAVLLGIPISLIFRSTSRKCASVPGTWYLCCCSACTPFCRLDWGGSFSMYISPENASSNGGSVYSMQRPLPHCFLDLQIFWWSASHWLQHVRIDVCTRSAIHWGGVVVQLALSSLRIINVAIWILTFVFLR